MHEKNELQSYKDKLVNKRLVSKDYSKMLPHLNAGFRYKIQTHNRFDILAVLNKQLNNIHSWIM